MSSGGEPMLYRQHQSPHISRGSGNAATRAPFQEYFSRGAAPPTACWPKLSIPVGAATPRRECQINDRFSRGAAPPTACWPKSSIPVGAATPRRECQFKNASVGAMPLPQHAGPSSASPWERQRRDASARSMTASVGAKPLPQAPWERQRRDASVNSRMLQSWRCPSHKIRGSGNAATRAPIQEYFSRGAAPPTKSLGAATPR